MTTSDLQRIERELRILLPGDYKSLMTAYPFPHDSFSADCLLPDNADRLLEIAKDRQKLPVNSFIIGDDSADETYFIDVSRMRSPVFVFDVSSGKVSESFPDLGTYVEHCKKTDQELYQYAKRVENRKWWQFWIPKQ
ncbi:MAG TPA: SMI1/KNR4 family protein [Candidatus Acidoferrales bacterium]|nr:SMI1/KNR4 family protein [Candidatus Acidoferrales bacterium]